MNEAGVDSMAPASAAAGMTGARGPFPAASILLPVASACLLRCWIGVRPFPSIDELAYAPSFRAADHAAPYARDLMVSGMPNHALLWSLTFRFAEATGHPSAVMYALTFALSVLTLVALFRLMRACQVPGALLPVAALLGFAGILQGFGRGTYDGAFGLGLHGQWMAIVALMLAYGALARQRSAEVGLWLGVAVLSHVAVAVHGVVGVIFGILASRPRAQWFRSLTIAAVVCLVVGSPVIVRIAIALLSPDARVVAAGRVALEVMPGIDIIQDLWRRRLIHEFTWNVEALEGAALPVYLMAGAAGVVVLRRASGAAVAARAIAGLLAAHVTLGVAAVIFYGPLANVSQTPYLLSLTRTTPLIIVLASCAAAAALERTIGESRTSRAVLALATPVLLLLILFVRWTPALAALFVLGGLALAASLSTASARLRWGAAAFAVVAGAVALSVAIGSDRRTLAVAPADQELYRFAHGAEPADALFIIPPGLDQFRYFAQRGVYVDWRLFPTPSPRLLPVWFQRLTQVAAPDASVLESRGWASVPLWDASYARQNNPYRIASLLASAQADYFVSDLTAPDLVRPAEEEVRRAGLHVAFMNSRFIVYESRGSADADVE